MIKDIIAYIQGNTRYKLFYSKNFSWLIRSHIREQILSRIISMDGECYDNGECKMCGCATTALQMANKACDKPCYPQLVSRRSWNKLKATQHLEDGKWGVRGDSFVWTLSPNDKFEKHEIKPEHMGKSSHRLRKT